MTQETEQQKRIEGGVNKLSRYPLNVASDAALPTASKDSCRGAIGHCLLNPIEASDGGLTLQDTIRSTTGTTHQREVNEDPGGNACPQMSKDSFTASDDVVTPSKDYFTDPSKDCMQLAPQDCNRIQPNSQTDLTHRYRRTSDGSCLHLSPCEVTDMPAAQLMPSAATLPRRQSPRGPGSRSPFQCPAPPNRSSSRHDLGPHFPVHSHRSSVSAASTIPVQLDSQESSV